MRAKSSLIREQCNCGQWGMTSGEEVIVVVLCGNWVVVVTGWLWWCIVVVHSTMTFLGGTAK